MVENHWSDSVQKHSGQSDSPHNKPHQFSDTLNEFRFGAVSSTSGNAELLAPSPSPQDPMEAPLHHQMAGVAARMHNAQNDAQRTEILQQTSQLIRLHGFNLTPNDALEFNRRMASAGAPTVQLIRNPDAAPGEPQWFVRFRNINPPNGEEEPILVPVP